MTKEKFNYVISADLLKHVEECPSMIIVNTDCYTEKGEHWLLMYLPDTTTIEIYDSLCNDISCYPQDITQFITKFKTIRLSKGTKQPMNSLLCGYYCLYYAHMRCQGIDMMKRIKSCCYCSAFMCYNMYCYMMLFILLYIVTLCSSPWELYLFLLLYLPLLSRFFLS